MGLNRTRHRIVWIKEDAGVVASIESLGATYWSESIVLGGQPAIVAYQYPYAAHTSLAAGQAITWLASADDTQVRAFNAEGRLETIVRFVGEPEKVSAADRDAHRRQFLAERDDGGRAAAQALERMGYPDALPYFGRAETDVEDNLWLERYAPLTYSGPLLWDVFSPDGAWLATVDFAEDLTPRCARDPKRLSPCDWILEIGRDYVLTKLRDEFDRAFVGVHPIEKG
jgi:hypothetical protein